MYEIIYGNFIDVIETNKVIKLIIVNSEGKIEEILCLKQYGWTIDGFDKEHMDKVSLEIQYKLGKDGQGKWLHAITEVDREEIEQKEEYVKKVKEEVKVKTIEGIVKEVQPKGRSFRYIVEVVEKYKKVNKTFITTEFIDIPTGVKVKIKYIESVSSFRGREQTSLWIQNMDIISGKKVVGSHIVIDCPSEEMNKLINFLEENDIVYSKEDKFDYIKESVDTSNRRIF